MFKNEMQKIADASVKKVEFMKKSPVGYTLLSALAGMTKVEFDFQRETKCLES